jgi:hypothetical protein
MGRMPYPYKEYYKTGEKKCEGSFADQKGIKPIGKWTRWYEDGTISLSSVYGDDSLPTGLWTTYWQNGLKQSEGRYQSGKKSGKWMHWHDNGQVSQQGNYTDGLKNGFWQYWEQDGSFMAAGHYMENRRNGTWEFCTDDPDKKYISEWFAGKLTNQAGAPPIQPKDHESLYYPVIPGQLEDFQTPFDLEGRAEKLYFGCLESGQRFTYLFKPVRKFTFYGSAYLTLVIWERYQTLLVLEKLYAASPDGSPVINEKDLVSKKKGKTKDRFMLISDPLSPATAKKFPYNEYATLNQAVKSARRLSKKKNIKTVVGRLIQSYPLDY